ncbi:hypothetical protein D9611_006764 [Ephemerocybe angulata]|uniref:Uncharacterized protein n=2 Tax=Ephemerocybe angulata TaxID=980116 RepID=A0A8H6MHA5_9AGAR|nr:hypothetical protein D9611_006764 [Tulosesus angulatus]KAF6766086.1 hypothetical protein DFP72DRAFT_1028845 [Tulosesus angulatus]
MSSKRALGAEEPKELSATLNEEEAAKLDAVRREIAKLDLYMEKQEILMYTPSYKKRQEITKTIPNFWPVALMHHNIILVHSQHSSDQTAFTYLEDIWVTRDPVEHRAFTIEFTFKENPYFSDKTLKKEFKYKAPEVDEAVNKPNEHGITDAMLEFDWFKHIEPSTIKINWKDDEHNLTKLYPRVLDEDDDDLPAESGSFFNFFEHKSDPFTIGEAIATEVFPNAIDYFMGDVEDSDVDSDDEEDDSEDDENEEEIDLEKPRPKKRKV